ncbi:hypothetical protein EVAR_384_1 [Eumeta japonica]|uniref:Uncharacterized protein n=1 Tax=Eumeta variegata TaxID=151549 RepID=A0A4C1SD45_EUMVA|nr:hypothetical protein EVAR_384_1 [Eumeta japonica]
MTLKLGAFDRVRLHIYRGGGRSAPAQVRDQITFRLSEQLIPRIAVCRLMRIERAAIKNPPAAASPAADGRGGGRPARAFLYDF